MGKRQQVMAEMGWEKPSDFFSEVADVRCVSAADREAFRLWRKSGFSPEVFASLPRRGSAYDDRFFEFDGPTVVHFSGGRTSGYLLWRLLQANDGKLPADVAVVFTNTGKERNETLDFIHQIEVEWGVDVHWVEYRPPVAGDSSRNSFVVRVNYESAFRVTDPDDRADGVVRPYDALLRCMADYRAKEKDAEPTLPGVRFRTCTAYLKIKSSGRYVRQVFGWRTWESLVGLRADEPSRVANIRVAPLEGGSEPWTPLADAGVDEDEVMRFWREHPFDLDLRQGAGNCDLCYLKSVPKLLALIKRNPDEAKWWAEKEAWSGMTFRKSKKESFAMLLERAASMTEDEILDLDKSGLYAPSIPCTCTD